MDTRLLKMFAAVARHGALPAASREMHLTASALSHGLKALESELGTRVFDRIGKRLVLNQAGEQLLAQIQEPLAALEKAASAVKALGKWGQGRLRIGAPGAACQHLMPAVLRELNRRYAKLLLVIECGESAELLDLLRQHRIDLAISIEPENTPELELKPLFEDELLFAFSSEHPWADGRALSPEEVSRQPLILSSRTSWTAQKLQQFFAAQEIEPTSIMEIGNTATIKELVKRSVAVAVLAPWVCDRELALGSVKMRPLSGKGLRRRWTIAHSAQRRLGLPEEDFIKLCRGHVASMRLDRKDLPRLDQTRRD